MTSKRHYLVKCALSPGMTKNTYGTGCFMLRTIGPKPIASAHRLLTTIAWKIGDRLTYALEGSIFVGGAVVQWLRDGLGIIQSASEIEKLAASVADNGGVYLVPAFSGLGAPQWDPYARGTIIGPQPRQHQGAHRAGGSRRHRLSGRRFGGRHDRRHRNGDPRIACRRRRVPE